MGDGPEKAWSQKGPMTACLVGCALVAVQVLDEMISDVGFRILLLCTVSMHVQMMQQIVN